MMTLEAALHSSTPYQHRRLYTELILVAVRALVNIRGIFPGGKNLRESESTSKPTASASSVHVSHKAAPWSRSGLHFTFTFGMVAWAF